MRVRSCHWRRSQAVLLPAVRRPQSNPTGAFMILTIRKKLLAGALGSSLLLLFLGFYALHTMKSLNADTIEIGTNWLPSTQYIGLMTADLNRLRVLEAQMLAAPSEEFRR